MRASPVIEIERLVLRLPGVDPIRARALAADIAARVAAAVPTWDRDRLPPRLDLRVQLTAGASPAELAAAVAAAIARALR